MMKTVFILSGFNLKQHPTDGYGYIQNGLESKGYRVVLVDVKWHYKRPSDYVKAFIEIFESQKSEENIVIGNSFGAVVAFLAATEVTVEALYVCSLSPFFKEDRNKLPDSYGIRHFGIKRMRDLWAISADKIAADMNPTKVYVLYGEKEHQTSPLLVARAKQTAGGIRGARLIEIAGAPHDMGDEVYSRALVRLIEPADGMDAKVHSHG